MSSIGYPQLAALSERGHASVVRHGKNLRLRNGAKQVAHQAVELGVGDQVGSLLVAQRTAEHARQANEALASAGQAVWLVAGRDQFTLNAEAGGLQWDKIDVPESRAVNTLAKHDC